MVTQNKAQREIKFRIWQNDKAVKRMILPKDMVEYVELCFIPRADNTMRAAFLVDDGKVAPQRFFLMQFTGLHDNIGVQIWEGDIVRGYFTGNYPAVIECDAPNGGYNIRELDEDGEYQDIDSNTIIEVIGNIYENPELLGVK